MGERRKSMEKLEHMFENTLSSEHGGVVDGLPLGVAGDTAPNVLWRLLHGEMEEGFDPSIWWISLGNNDLGRMQCSEEIVEIGILRVVEEILEKRPNAHVVINSIFPMTDLRGGLYPVISDYRDSFLPPTSKRSFLFGKRKNDMSGGVVENAPGRRKLLRSLATSTLAGNDNDDAILQERARKEEEARDKKAKMENYYRKHNVENPVMRDSTTASKFRPGTFRLSKKPIWTSIKSINKGLEKFARSNPRVTFFDCTPLFVTVDKEKSGKSTLLTSLISMRGRPTLKGFKVLESQMAKTVNELLEQYNLRQFHPADGDDGLVDDFFPHGDVGDDAFGDFSGFGDGASIIGPGMIGDPSKPGLDHDIELPSSSTSSTPRAPDMDDDEFRDFGDGSTIIGPGMVESSNTNLYDHDELSEPSTMSDPSATAVEPSVVKDDPSTKVAQLGGESVGGIRYGLNSSVPIEGNLQVGGLNSPQSLQGELPQNIYNPLQEQNTTSIPEPEFSTETRETTMQAGLDGESTNQPGSFETTVDSHPNVTDTSVIDSYDKNETAATETRDAGEVLDPSISDGKVAGESEIDGATKVNATLDERGDFGSP